MYLYTYMNRPLLGMSSRLIDSTAKCQIQLIYLITFHLIRITYQTFKQQKETFCAIAIHTDHEMQKKHVYTLYKLQDNLFKDLHKSNRSLIPIRSTQIIQSKKFDTYRIPQV